MSDTPAREPFVTSSAAALMLLEFEERVSPVENLITEGLTLLCGASKIGKSWFVLSLCCAVSSGRPFLGRKTQQGPVLYLALEDSAERLQYRLKALGENPTDDFQYRLKVNTVGMGLLDDLEQWVGLWKPKLIIVDTLQKVRDMTPSRTNLYAEDYRLMGQLKAFADKHRLALVLVHHLNKGRDVADPFDRISGSTGLMGAADTSIILYRERGSELATLAYTGRDVWGDDVSLRMCDGRWTVVGKDTVEREVYEDHPITRTVKWLLARGFGGTAEVSTEGFKEAIVQACGNCPYGTLKSVSTALAGVSADLLRFDGITIERPKVGTKRGWRFMISEQNGGEF